MYEKARQKCLEDNNTNQKAKSAFKSNLISDEKENNTMEEDEASGVVDDVKVTESPSVNSTGGSARRSLSVKQNITPSPVPQRRTRRTKK